MKLKNLWLIAVAILIYACNAEETRSWEVTFDPNKPKDPNEQSIINVAAGKFYKMNVVDRKSTRLNSSHKHRSRMPSSA